MRVGRPVYGMHLAWSSLDMHAYPARMGVCILLNIQPAYGAPQEPKGTGDNKDGKKTEVFR